MNDAPVCAGPASYDREYFIRKFEGIAEDRWCTGAFRRGRCRCALGHCGADYGFDPNTGRSGVIHTDESRALVALFSGQTEVAHINDGIAIHRQASAAVAHFDTPRQRMLAALRKIGSAA